MNPASTDTDDAHEHAAQNPMSAIPERVGGRYRVSAEIGRGGMATVYRGHDDQLNRPVAVKLMRAELGENERFRKRFEVEARRAASVTHPNVVSVYDFGTDPSPYMVMELIEAGDLSRALADEGRLAPDRAARIAAESAAALQAAHDAGLVHRDVKPGNILLDTDGHARVADFGIARATGEESLTKTGAMLGSVEYFSPEQARGERATAASDVYALGVVLFEMLTGRRPFRGDSPYAVATARLRGAVPDPRDSHPDLPPGLAGIAMTAMAVKPAARYGSAAEMRDALETWRASADAEPIVAASPASTRMYVEPQPPRRPPPPRNQRRPLWLGAALLLLLAVGGYVGAQIIAGWPDDTEVGGPLDVIVGTPDGEAADDPTPTPEPTSTPTLTPPATAEVPTESPIETATPAQATPLPTAVPEPPSPTPAPIAAAGAPRDAVAAFYRFVARGDFDAAYALWSDRMKAAFPRQGNLDDRFANTAEITFSQLFVASQSATTATVQANFTERYDSGSSQNFTGHWRLVRVDGAWLLDEPTY